MRGVAIQAGVSWLEAPPPNLIHPSSSPITLLHAVSSAFRLISISSRQHFVPCLRAPMYPLYLHRARVGLPASFSMTSWAVPFFSCSDCPFCN